MMSACSRCGAALKAWVRSVQYGRVFVEPKRRLCAECRRVIATKRVKA